MELLFLVRNFFYLTQFSWISALFHGSSMNELTGYRVVKVAGQVFNGNRTHSDHFNSIHLERSHMLVGARNFIFNVSLHNLNEHRRISWSSNDVDTDLCLRRQKTLEDCQNYIRVIVRTSHDEFYACGTNSYRPMCRVYKTLPQSKKHAVLIDEESGTAKVPFDHRHNSTAVYHNGRLYSATVADVNGRDALIYSKPLRTEQHDSQWLNDPSFVSSFAYGDRVYFFFREAAVENINCGKVIFSRVARVCANDSGGSRVLRNTWTSFSKARLNCSLPGEFPFHFNEIQATSELGSGSLRSSLMTSEQAPMIYALFSTPSNSIRGSAVCAFQMSDIIRSFEGPYKEQRNFFHNWLPVRDAPVPHPGVSCPNSSSMPDQTLNFVKSHPLMDYAVPTFGGEPIFIQTGFDFTLTTIAVDWQVEAANHRFYDVIFLGTDNGRVVKVYNKGRGMGVQTVVSEVLEVFQDNSPVTQLRIFNSPARRHREKKLLVVSRNEIKSIFLHRCSAATTCSACVDLKDPYCAWKDHKCSHSSHGFQNLETGHHPGCESITQEQQHTLTTSTRTTTTTDYSVTTHHEAPEAYYPQFQARMEPVEPNYDENLSSFQLLHRLPVPINVTECPVAVVPSTSTNMVSLLSAVLLTFVFTFPLGVLIGRLCRTNFKFVFPWCHPDIPASTQEENATLSLKKAKFPDDSNLSRALPNSYEIKTNSRVPTLQSHHHNSYISDYPRPDNLKTCYPHYNL